MRRWMCAVLALTVLLCLTACGSVDQKVSVQRADQVALDGANGQRFAAMVVSEDVTNIQRDMGKTILECYVEQGQDVKAGDKLFTYDSEALELELEKQNLELEKMKNEQVTYAEQLQKLEKELANTWSESKKTQLTLEINVLKTTQLENDYAILAKEKSIEDIQGTLAQVDVVSPVDGTIRKVDETEGAQYYITIQQHGAYRLKGTINEMNMGVLMPGSRIKAVSRVDESQFWMGTVSSVDTEDASQDNVDMWSSNVAVDMMTTSSGYVFYAEMDSTEGLLLGQHVYVELYQETLPGLWLPEVFLTDFTMDETTGEMTAAVWASNGTSALEKRTVSLGMYDGMTGCYEILAGLAGEEYVADPMDPNCREGAAVSSRQAADFSGQTEG